MADFEPRVVLESRAELGEHPLWNAADRALYWLDIDGETINRFDPASGANTAWTLPSQPGCFAFRDDGRGAVIAARHGMYEIDFASGAVERVMAPGHDPEVFRANDGKTDRQGRLWFGVVRLGQEVFNTAGTAYWRYDGRTLVKGLSEVGMTNGTAFSADGRTLYRADTASRRIFAHDYDPERGTAAEARLFAVAPDHVGLPDGATVDDAGGYWCALAVPPPGRVGGVGRFTPDGRLDVFFELPAPFVTMVAFGGQDLSTLYITTGRISSLTPDEPPEAAGNLFAVETGFRGAPEAPFRSR